MEILGRKLCPRLVKSHGTAKSSWNVEIVDCIHLSIGKIFNPVLQHLMELFKSFVK